MAATLFSKLFLFFSFLFCASFFCFDVEGGKILDTREEDELKPYEVALKEIQEHELNVNKRIDEPKCKGKCAPVGAIPTCKPKQKALLVYVDKKCNCKGYRCIFIDCEAKGFNKNKPPVCKNPKTKKPDCALVPKQGSDCGCPVWECRPRICSDFAKYKTPDCDSCSREEKTGRECGCDVRKCKPIPPPEDECKKGCPKCKKCATKPWMGTKCSKKTGFQEKTCDPIRCSDDRKYEAKTCSECEEKKTKRECGCTIENCVPKKSVDKCKGGCPKCTQCKEKPLISAKCAAKPFGVTEKTCERQPCKVSKKATCGKCQKVKTTKDDCGCAKEKCMPPDVINECPCKHPCKKCVETVFCKDGKNTVKQKKCERIIEKPKPAPPCPCGKLKPTEDKCGALIWKCIPNPTCKPAVEPKCPPCQEAKKLKDECGCPAFKCKPLPPLNATAVCELDCPECKVCKRIPDPACGKKFEKFACVNSCPPFAPPSKPQCFEQNPGIDKCGCRKIPKRKPCVMLPEGKCENGTTSCPTKDGCGCTHPRTCCECPPKVDPKSCKKCEQHISKQEGNCVVQECVRKICPKPKTVACGRCFEKYMHTDTCHCCEERCVPVKCTPPSKPACGKGTVAVKGKNGCGCATTICSPPAPGPTPKPGATTAPPGGKGTVTTAPGGKGGKTTSAPPEECPKDQCSKYAKVTRCVECKGKKGKRRGKLRKGKNRG